VYYSLNIIMVIKSRRMRWAGRITLMGEEECVQGFMEMSEARRSLGRARRR
jgi:hypothetical protein